MGKVEQFMNFYFRGEEGRKELNEWIEDRWTENPMYV